MVARASLSAPSNVRAWPGGRRVWDVEELDMAFKLLPREGGDDEAIFDVDDRGRKSNPWDVLLR